MHNTRTASSMPTSPWDLRTFQFVTHTDLDPTSSPSYPKDALRCAAGVKPVGCWSERVWIIEKPDVVRFEKTIFFFSFFYHLHCQDTVRLA